MGCNTDVVQAKSQSYLENQEGVQWFVAPAERCPYVLSRKLFPCPMIFATLQTDPVGLGEDIQLCPYVANTHTREGYEGWGMHGP